MRENLNWFRTIPTGFIILFLFYLIYFEIERLSTLSTLEYSISSGYGAVEFYVDIIASVVVFLILIFILDLLIGKIIDIRNILKAGVSSGLVFGIFLGLIQTPIFYFFNKKIFFQIYFYFTTNIIILTIIIGIFIGIMYGIIYSIIRNKIPVKREMNKSLILGIIFWFVFSFIFRLSFLIGEISDLYLYMSSIFIVSLLGFLFLSYTFGEKLETYFEINYFKSKRINSNNSQIITRNNEGGE